MFGVLNIAHYSADIARLQLALAQLFTGVRPNMSYVGGMSATFGERCRSCSDSTLTDRMARFGCHSKHPIHYYSIVLVYFPCIMMIIQHHDRCKLAPV